MCTKLLMQRFHKLARLPHSLFAIFLLKKAGTHALFRPSTPHIPYPAATVLRCWMPLDTGSAYTAAKCPTKTTSRLIVPSSRLQVYSFDGFRTCRSSYYPGIRCIQVLLLPYPYMVILTGRVCNLLV
ncbi:hypothetical protein BKA83DRAFT_4311244 [Pisolithus microcarpus]|nr:hypothetical protein BKA83DRAFT_4311244 [Pisolithus microcarpus]